MAVKTILVHLGPDPESPGRLAVAADLAKRQDARLLGLYVVLPMDVPGARIGDGLNQARDAAADLANREQVAFEALCAGHGIRGDFIFELGDAAEHLAEHGRCADLIAVSQDGPRTAFADFHSDLTEYLPFAASAPVLVLPRGFRGPVDTSFIAVAWKSGKEAATAVRNALPLLKEADQVRVITVQEQGDDEIRGGGIGRFLAEHGVKVELARITASAGHTGEAILAEAKAMGAGLIVMGVYGHSRLRVRILGGVSKHVLGHSPVPLLVSH